MALKHTTIILLRIGHQARVLLGIKELIFGHEAVAAQIVLSMPPEIPELSDDLLLAARTETQPGGIAIALRSFSEVIKAGIATPSPRRRRRVGFLKIVEDSVHG